MGKLTSFNGVATGKVGANVFSVVSGQQVVRSYQPNVANPSTSAQVNVRAKLKLMSQLAADLSTVIAIPKDGMVSRRNQFIKANYEKAIATGGVAQITYENVQLTKGTSYLPAIVATRTVDTGLTVALGAAAPNVDRVVYVIAQKDDNNRLSIFRSIIVSEGGEEYTYESNIGDVSGEVVIFAYGMKDTNASASAKYANMKIMNGSDLASLVATRSLSTTDYSFTTTRGATLAADGSAIEPVPSGSARVYVTASGNGTVAGAGTFTIGSEVTVTATPAANTTFDGWYANGDFTTRLSSSTSYTFMLQGTTDLVARFIANGSDEGSGGGDGGLE